MGKHLAEETLMDILEGSTVERAESHLGRCLHCRTRVEQARAGLVLAREADIPEPSPFYWESFRRQVGRRIEAGEPAAVSWRRLFVGPALATAAAGLAALSLFVPSPSRPVKETAALLPAWSALPPAEEDAGLGVLLAVIPASDGLGPAVECGGLSQCLDDLSDEESLAVANALRRELEGGREL